MLTFSNVSPCEAKNFVGLFISLKVSLAIRKAHVTIIQLYGFLGLVAKNDNCCRIRSLLTVAILMLSLDIRLS